MSWKEKIVYSKMVEYCVIHRSKAEISEHFGLSPIEAWHAIKWFSKFEDDFTTVKDAGGTNKAWWIKSTQEALNHSE